MMNTPVLTDIPIDRYFPAILQNLSQDATPAQVHPQLFSDAGLCIQHGTIQATCRAMDTLPLLIIAKNNARKKDVVRLRWLRKNWRI